MVNITKEKYENNNIEVITDKFGKIWLNEMHLQEQLGHKHLRAVTKKYYEEYKKYRYELINDLIKQPNRKFIRNDLALKIIMDCRTNESCNLKKMHLKEKICSHNTLFYVFINTNLQLKLMN